MEKMELFGTVDASLGLFDALDPQKAKKAMIVGMACMSLGSTLTGCGVASPTTTNLTEAQLSDKQTVIDKINAAHEVTVDINTSKYKQKFYVSTEEGYVALTHGYAVYMSDDVSLETDDGKIINKGNYTDSAVLAIYDSEGELRYEIQESRIDGVIVYLIVDAYNGPIAYMDKIIAIEQGQTLYIFDMEGNPIVDIEFTGAMFTFTIKPSDKCSIDNTDLTTICTNYMRELFVTSKFCRDQGSKELSPNIRTHYR